MLLEAVRRLDADGVRLRLLLGGEGRERADLERRAAGLPVRLTGFEAEPRRLFAQADLFVLPSRVEALPLVLVEAVSAGLPAVATDVGDVREALAGVVELVPPDDPAALAGGLRRLLDDPADRDRRGRARDRRGARAPHRAADGAAGVGGVPARPHRQRLPQHPVGADPQRAAVVDRADQVRARVAADVLAHDRLQARRVPPAARDRPTGTP